MPPRRAGRRVPPPSPAAILRRAVITSHPGEAVAGDTATEDHTLGPGRIVTGVEQHQLTGHHHTFVSLYGNDLTVVGVFRDPLQAQALAGQVGDLYRNWYVIGEEASAVAQEALHRAAERTSVVPPDRWLLPDDQVRAVLAQIAAQVLREN